jgi:threonine/homoserine/homoserine lactone efflux protein
VFAALGISALLMSSVLAFSVVRYAGAAYLLYLGIKTLLTGSNVVETEGKKAVSLGRTFSQAVIINLLNPKSALFFFAFLPQFIDIERGSVTPQILLLGCIVVVIGLMSGLSYSLLATTAGNLFRRNLRFLKAQRYFAGSVYLCLGTATALSGTSER